MEYVAVYFHPSDSTLVNVTTLVWGEITKCISNQVLISGVNQGGIRSTA